MERKAFEQIVRQYSEPLYWQIRRIVLNHEDANDVLQNTFIKAWTAIDTFQDDAKIGTWLSRIAINESIDFLRRNERVVSSADEDLSVANSLMADSYFDGTETEALLQEAIATLPDVQRTVFQLRYFEDMKYSEISEILHTTEGALKASYHIAVKKIYEFFKAHD
jgi:RNA polymerase sigma-70 factor (ECF subfamily)